MTEKNVLIEIREDIIIATLNRPEALNALNDDLMDELSKVVDQYEENTNLKCLILTGSEKAFAAGADIKQMQPKSYMDVYKEDFITRNWERISRCRKPTIAAVSGYALGGGCELACFADIRICSDNASFGVPAARLGISIGYKEMRRLIELVGLGNVNYILLSARTVGASDALRMGLVNQVVPMDEIDEYISKLASGIASLAPLSHQDNKRIASLVLKNPGLNGLTPEQEALPYRVFDSYDYQEGRRAFVEKRRPNFEGR